MTSLYQALKINGVISTDKTVLQNLNDLCTAAGAFLTYDISQGKWAVVINKTGTSIKSYNNTNIIGSINISESGVSELYNSVSLEFPHRILRDQTDFVQVAVSEENRFPNEVDNTLSIQSDLINDPVQAQYIAGIELKQSRLNKIISFTTDYTSLGMKAGDLIDVTSEMYGYTNKIFRITKIEENDEDVIGITITALEYSADVYSTSGLVATEKTKKTGILLKQQNEELKKADDADVSRAISRMIAANVGLGVVNKLLNKLFGRNQIGTDANGNPIYDNQTKPNDEDVDRILGNVRKPPLSDISGPTSICSLEDEAEIVVTSDCTSCLFDIPDLEYPYEITGISEDQLTIPLEGTVLVSGGIGTLTIGVTEEALASSTSINIDIGNLSYTVGIGGAPNYSYGITKNNSSITEGGSVVVTLTATGSKANATIPYEITGSAVSKVTSPSLTGTVTTSGGTASLTINTSVQSGYQGTQGLTITFDPDVTVGCGASINNSTSVTVLDNDPAPPEDVTRQYVLTPVVWGGVYDGTTGQLKSVSVFRSAYLPIPFSGEASVNVPVTVSVTQGNPSSLTVTSTIAISTSILGGTELLPIITFNTVASNSPIQGTRTSVWGYF